MPLENSLTTPCGVILPTFASSGSVNHTLPSGPAAIPVRLAVTENSVIVTAVALLAIPSDEASASTAVSTPLVPRRVAMRMAPSPGRRQNDGA